MNLEVLPKDNGHKCLILERQAHWGRSKELGMRQAHSIINKPKKVLWGTHVLDVNVEKECGIYKQMSIG